MDALFTAALFFLRPPFGRSKIEVDFEPVFFLLSVDMSFPSDPNCIFCKIVAGEIPCHKLYEDDLVLSFLDIGPLSPGHALVIPKAHGVELGDVEDAAVQCCVSVARMLAPHLVEMTGASGWNLLQNNGKTAGQEVGHVHFHIIPRKERDGLGYRWNAGEVDHDQAAELVAGVKSRLQA